MLASSLPVMSDSPGKELYRVGPVPGCCHPERSAGTLLRPAGFSGRAGAESKDMCCHSFLCRVPSPGRGRRKLNDALKSIDGYISIVLLGAKMEIPARIYAPKKTWFL